MRVPPGLVDKIHGCSAVPRLFFFASVAPTSFFPPVSLSRSLGLRDNSSFERLCKRPRFYLLCIISYLIIYSTRLPSSADKRRPREKSERLVISPYHPAILPSFFAVSSSLRFRVILPIMANTPLAFPPESLHSQLSDLIFNIKDWQITHGMLLKYKVHDYSEARPVGVSMFPSLLPRALFEEAEALQPIYNRLYAAVSNDEEWLFGVLEG